MKVQACLPDAKQGENARPSVKNVQARDPRASDILKAIQKNVQAARQDAQRQAYQTAAPDLPRNVLFGKDIISEQEQKHKLPEAFPADIQDILAKPLRDEQKNKKQIGSAAAPKFRQVRKDGKRRQGNNEQIKQKPKMRGSKTAAISGEIGFLCKKQSVLLPVSACITVKKDFRDIGHDRNQHKHSEEKGDQ